MFDSRASLLVRGPEHNSPSKTYCRLSERDSRPPISSESANIDRVEPLPQDSETYLRALGDTKSRLVCGGQGRSMYMFPLFGLRYKRPRGIKSEAQLSDPINWDT